MSEDTPSYRQAYKVFDCSANVDADDDFMDESVERNDHNHCTVGMLNDVAKSCHDFHAMMEQYTD